MSEITDPSGILRRNKAQDDTKETDFTAKHSLFCALLSNVKVLYLFSALILLIPTVVVSYASPIVTKTVFFRFLYS